MRSRIWCVGTVALAFACADETQSVPDAGTPDMGGPVDVCGDLSDPCQIQPGETRQESIAPVGDVDSYELQMAPGQVLDVDIRYPERRPVQLRAVLFGPGGTAVLSAQNMGGPAQPQRVRLNYPVAEAGIHRIDVSDVGSDDEDLNPASPYSITVTLVTQSDDNEPNDGPAEATELALNTPMAGVGQIGTPGDVDWFRFELSDNQIVRVDASGTAGDPAYRWELLRDGAFDSPVAQATQPWAPTQRAVGQQGGVYFLRVVSTDPMSSDLERTYTLTVDTLPEPDPNEIPVPNDQPDDATPLSLPQAIQGRIAAAGDLDLYRFDVSGASPSNPVVVEADLESLNPDTSVNLEFALLDSELRVLPPAIENSEPGVPDEPGLALRRLNRGDQLTRQGEIRCHDDLRCRTAHPIFEDGTYYVRVRDRNETQFDEASAYTLRVRELPDVDTTETYSDGATLITTTTTAPVLDYGWIEGYISYTGDVDRYRFEVPTEGFEQNPPQNGDWEINYELEVDAPTGVEFFIISERPDRRTETPAPNPCSGQPSDMLRDPCDRTEGENQSELNLDIGGIAGNQCTFIFREEADRRFGGDFVVRIFDVSWLPDTDGDDYDVTVPYRFRLRLKAGCDPMGPCMGEQDCTGS
jgi:hypothetical protein